MEFHEFAQLLKPIIGGASNISDFVKTLFDAITTENDDSGLKKKSERAKQKTDIGDRGSILEETSDETYKSYYYGETGISRIAKKLMPFADPVGFIDYCEPFSDATMNTLYETFKPHIPDMTKYDIAESLADFFYDIMKTAASTKRKNMCQKNDVENNTENIEAEVVDDEEPSGAASENKTTVIHQQTNVIQNGEHNFNLTNNGVMNFNF